MPELWDTPVTYGAIGATQAPDLLRFPPAGYRPIERRARIGHGDARFEYACASAMSWGIQRGSGVRIRTINSPETASHEAATAHNSSESTFGPDGTAFVRPGDTAELFISIVGSIGVKAPARVVYVINEAKRKGFAYGTLPGHPEDGEEAFIVSQNLDGSVWLTVRAFSRPSSRWWWAVYPALRLAQELYTRRYLRALAKPFD